jgi:hypothetical protein
MSLDGVKSALLDHPNVFAAVWFITVLASEIPTDAIGGGTFGP